MSLERPAWIFPGQGSQYVGMGKDLFEKHRTVQRLFEKADRVFVEAQSSGALESYPARAKSLSALCFEGPEEELNRTRNTQACVFAVNYALFSLLKEHGYSPYVVAGHSLGEYTALAATGVIDFSDGLKLVVRRGQLMDEASKSHPGKMLAVLGLDAREVERLTQMLPGNSVEIANYNCPGQVVISGPHEAVAGAEDMFKNAGARKVVELKVSGGFHSPLMAGAEEAFGAFLSAFTFRKAAVPVVSNVTAQVTSDPDRLKEAVRRQVTGPVKWEQSIEAMVRYGARTFVEVGPGKVLSGLVKRTTTNPVYNVEDLDTLNRFMEVWG